MQLLGEHIAEHFGKTSESSNGQAGSTAVRGWLLSVNVVYTGLDTTMTALRAVESLARDLSAIVHVRAMITVPRQLAIDFALTSFHFFKRLISDLIERVGCRRFEYVLHIYVCRNRIDTLLRVLRPSSLLVIGGRRRLWRTAESRICKAAISAGHNVAFVNAKAF
jgi:hypothetical protein